MPNCCDMANGLDAAHDPILCRSQSSRSSSAFAAVFRGTHVGRTTKTQVLTWVFVVPGERLETSQGGFLRRFGGFLGLAPWASE